MNRPTITAVAGIPSGNHGGQRSGKPTHITQHHIVGDAGSAIAHFQNTKSGICSTYVIGSDGRIWQCLPDMTIPYTDGNMASNRRAITIEHAGGHTTGPNWPTFLAWAGRYLGNAPQGGH